MPVNIPKLATQQWYQSIYDDDNGDDDGDDDNGDDDGDDDDDDDDDEDDDDKDDDATLDHKCIPDFLFHSFSGSSDNSTSPSPALAAPTIQQSRFAVDDWRRRSRAASGIFRNSLILTYL